MSFKAMTMKVGKLVAFALSILLLLSSTPATAAVIPPSPFKASITGGQFSVDTVSPPLSAETVIRRAIISLPSSETGKITSIKITGIIPNKTEEQILFNCSNIKVQDGVDLIKVCGGPAELLAGVELRYQASGMGFNPDGNTILEVLLRDDFDGES